MRVMVTEDNQLPDTCFSGVSRWKLDENAGGKNRDVVYKQIVIVWRVTRGSDGRYRRTKRRAPMATTSRNSMEEKRQERRSESLNAAVKTIRFAGIEAASFSESSGASGARSSFPRCASRRYHTRNVRHDDPKFPRKRSYDEQAEI